MSPFTDTAGTTTLLTTFDEKGITYLATTNAGWLPYLADKGISIILLIKWGGSLGWIKTYPMILLPSRSLLLLYDLFCAPSAFEFWSKHFTAVTIPGSHKEGLCTTTMHGYWQVVMTSFGRELLGGRGFSLIPLEGLHAIISANPQLLLPTKSVVT